MEELKIKANLFVTRQHRTRPEETGVSTWSDLQTTARSHRPQLDSTRLRHMISTYFFQGANAAHWWAHSTPCFLKKTGDPLFFKIQANKQNKWKLQWVPSHFLKSFAKPRIGYLQFHFLQSTWHCPTPQQALNCSENKPSHSRSTRLRLELPYASYFFTLDELLLKTDLKNADRE